MYEHPDASHLQIAKTVYGGWWRRVTWDENVLGRGGNREARDKKESQGRSSQKMDVLVLARFDQGVPWDSEHVVDLRGDKAIPQEAKDRPKEWLFLFDDPEAANALDFYFREPPELDPKARDKLLKSEDAARLAELAKALAPHDDWRAEALEAAVRAWTEARSLDMKAIAQPARVALTGRSASPPLFEVMAVLGKDRSLARLARAKELAAT